MLICSEKFWQNEKHYENNLTSACSKEFQSTYENDFTLICFQESHSQNERHHESSLTFWQMSDLILMLVNKLVTAMLRAGEQYSYHIRRTDSETEYLIQVLSLQAITWSKIRLTADNLVSFRKTTSFDSLIRKSTSFNSLNVRKKKLSILNLIKDIQEFDLQCRQISSQLCEKLKENFLFTLTKNEILRKMNYVFMSQQKMIWSQLLKFYHDCSSEDY